MELPDEECEESKPPTERSCHLESCNGDSVPYMPEFPHTGDADDVIYDWEYIGFTPCSATCIGGTQEAIAVCRHEQTKQTVNETLCDSTKRPPAMTRVCNTRLCPPRWQVSPWRQCSATCGVGIQTREARCQQPGGSIVTPENCKTAKKPHTLQACNQIDCPPGWHIEEWQQCSHTCGGGTQNRKVTCRQLLMDGSFLKLADEKCHEPRLSTHKPCAKIDCPPELVVGEWSKCSVSCGAGTQRRNPTCQKLTAKGQQVALNGAVCNGLPVPLLVRPCRMDACNKLKPEIKPKLLDKYASHGPRILSIHRVYIQTRQEKRINFTIGSRAYLLPKTSVIIKCPVRRFQKSLIQWEKDGQRLQISKRLGVTKSGSLKVHSLEASDIGVYKCIAGPAQETFVLKLIGTDNRLIEPPAFRKHMGESSSAEHNEANSFGAKWHKMSQMWQLWNQKSKQYLGDRQANDQPFLRHLETHRRNSAEGYSSHEFKNKRLEAVVLPGAYSMDTVHFEELIKNLSHLVEAGEVNDDLASELVYQLIAELSKPPQAASEKLKEPQGERSSPKKPGKSADVSDNLSTKPQDSISHKSPVIARQKEGPKVYSNKTVTVRVGSTVFLTKDIRVINLLCEAGGVGDLKYTWTKDGMELKSSEKVILETSGNVQILNPTKKEMGMYRCMVENDFGSDAGISALFYAVAPSILSSVTNITHLELRNLSVAVGGTILVGTGANITLECPVQGLPQPDVSWLKNKSSSKDLSFAVQNGSLVLRNVSRESTGTYTCVATNALGKAVAATVLRVAERRFQGANNGSSSSSSSRRRKRVLMASGIGTNVSVVPGDLLRIGCPVHPNTRNPIRWFFKHQPIEEIEDFDHRILAGGRVLEVNITSSQFAGPYRCRAASSVKALSVWVNVKKEEYRWELGEWSPCSDPCGHLGTQFRRLQCVDIKEQRVNKSLCTESPRPVVHSRPCNIRDCPARWATDAWSECSASCGQGTRQRQSVCKQVQANGTAVALPPAACAHRERPSEQKPCAGHSCAEWLVQPWGQCTGRCIGPAVGLQHRLVQCQHRNGSAASSAHCYDRRRPSMRRNCSAEKCDADWRAGPWRPCTVECGSGFQSRQVDCVHRRNQKPVADQYCAWRKRPVTWQHCNVTSCDKGECKDTTHYCTFVKHLKLCLIELYKQRCCQSCGESYSSVESS
ncbi:hypothetical protein lerEdw1_010973 [Lerista edwardsae]|nr:hypothetical protein lerEdw1_010973 [Lerista edwardsae]